ncbi:hypothetical protein ACLMJK_003665 [Lecanora helva]
MGKVPKYRIANVLLLYFRSRGVGLESISKIVKHKTGLDCGDTALYGRLHGIFEDQSWEGDRLYNPASASWNLDRVDEWLCKQFEREEIEEWIVRDSETNDAILNHHRSLDDFKESDWLLRPIREGTGHDSAVDDNSAVDDSAVDDSAVDDSAVDDSAVDDSTMDICAVDDRAVDDSAVDDSVVDDSAMDDRAADASAMNAGESREPDHRPIRNHWDVVLNRD